jgi:hypothetical protein
LRGRDDYGRLTTNAVELTAMQYPKEGIGAGMPRPPTGLTVYMQFAEAGSLGCL